jgi:uncharacterized protein YxjI
MALSAISYSFRSMGASRREPNRRRDRGANAARNPHPFRMRAKALPAPYFHLMGLFRRGADAEAGHRFRMREKLLSIGDDFWIENDQGERAYKVDGKAMRIRKTFVLEDRDHNEVAKIQEKKLHVRGTMKVERGGETLATVHKALVGIRDRFDVDVEHGEDLKARGNIVDHEYEIKRDGDLVATISKKWFRVRDTYGIEVKPGEDEALLLALTVAIDDMSRPG